MFTLFKIQLIKAFLYIYDIFTPKLPIIDFKERHFSFPMTPVDGNFLLVSTFPFIKFYPSLTTHYNSNYQIKFIGTHYQTSINDRLFFIQKIDSNNHDYTFTLISQCKKSTFYNSFPNGIDVSVLFNVLHSLNSGDDELPPITFLDIIQFSNIHSIIDSFHSDFDTFVLQKLNVNTFDTSQHNIYDTIKR